MREDYYELWGEDQLLMDGIGSFEDWTHLVEGGHGARILQAHVPIAGQSPAGLAELRVGREWKIEAIEELSEPSAPRS